MDRDEIIKRIENLLNEHDMSARQVANEVGLYAGFLTDAKRSKGIPTLNVVAKISDYFRVSMDWIITGEESDTSNSLGNVDSKDMGLLAKFQTLSPEEQRRIAAFIDGMLAASSHDIGRWESLWK